MFYISSIKDNLVGIMDTYDNVEEFYSPSQVKKISKSIEIKGVSSKGIKKINLGEALLIREVIEEINCAKELSFEVVDSLAKYRLLFGSKVLSDDFMAVETDTSVKLVSTKTIMLADSIPDDSEVWMYKGLFTGTKFTKIDFHNTNTSNVECMGAMFAECEATSLDLSTFNTFNVENMECMFSGCHATTLDLSNFNTSNVENMNYMFTCNATSLNLSSFNTSNVEQMEGMFINCPATSLDLSSFDTSDVLLMEAIFDGYKGTIKATDTKLLHAYNDRRLA